jgi:hypothetical protein
MEYGGRLIRRVRRAIKRRFNRELTRGLGSREKLHTSQPVIAKE